MPQAQTQALTASESLKRIMGSYFMGCHEKARKGKFVVWVAIGVPIEVLHGFDLVVAVPENHSAVCGTRKVGAQQAQKAEAAGYSLDLCSYARIDIGTALANGEGSPSMGLPAPNLLISCTNNCTLLTKWFDVHHRRLNVPHFIIDVPFCYGFQREADREYLIRQYRALIDLIEKMTGQQWDEAKVKAAWDWSLQAYAHWRRFLGQASRHPAGITAFDTFLHMAPALTYYRGTKVYADHFKLLADETTAKADKGEVPVKDEKYRLIWDNIAPWHSLRKISSALATRGASLIYATYTGCIGNLEGGIEATDLSPRPLEALARVQNFSVCPYGLELRFLSIKRIVEKLKPDGIVFSSNRSCKPYSIMQLDLQRRVEKELGVPTVMVECDMADERFYNETQAFLRIDALLERIKNR